MSSNITIRLLGMLLFAFGGFLLSEALAPRLYSNSSSGFLELVLPLTIAGAILGLLVTPYLTVVPVRAIRSHLKSMSGADLVSILIGVFAGAVLGALLTVPMGGIPWGIGQFAPAGFTLLAIVLGAYVGYLRRRDLEAFGERLGRRAHDDFESSSIMPNTVRLPRVDSIMLTGPLRNDDLPNQNSSQARISTEHYLLVDTSAFIDGRIADICKTGFLEGTLLVPRFILNELQHIADSPDAMRRARGRRGLDILNRLQKDSTVPVQISEVDAEDVPEVDGKLVKIARVYKCPIITTDFNLNRVAEIQGVRVLNLNELANAIKPMVLPGEEMNVHVVQEGKELGQGVAYLDDGTMVVVENGRRHLNSDVEVVITRVLQTVAGRMIFAQMKNGSHDV